MKIIESLLKSLLLKIIVFFNPIKKQTPLPHFNKNSNLLFIRLNRIGDALVTTPLFDEIKNQIGCKLFILADKKNHFVFRNNPAIDEVFIFEKGFKGIFSINRIIKENNIEAVIDLHDDVSTTVSFLIAISNIKFKFGLRKSNSKIYTHVVDRLDSTEHHVIDRNLNLAALFNIKIDKKKVSVKFYPTEKEEKIAITQLAILNPNNKYLVGINISAGSLARFWGVENYKNLYSSLSIFDVKVIIFCSENELLFANKITDKKNIYPVTKDFGNFAAAIMKLNFLITPDTSVVHIASIKRIPTFGLYVKYDTEDMIWSPYNTDFESIVTEEPTLKNITSEEVKNKLIPFLENHINVNANTSL
jgi:ADP-heptose:LPS heptosyltransferase